MISRETRLVIAEYCSQSFTGSAWDPITCKHYPIISPIALYDFIYKNDFPQSICQEVSKLRESELNGIKNVILNISEEKWLLRLATILINKDEQQLEKFAATKEGLIKELKEAEAKEQDRTGWRRLIPKASGRIERQIQDVERQEESLLARIGRAKSLLQNDGYSYDNGVFHKVLPKERLGTPLLAMVSRSQHDEEPSAEQLGYRAVFMAGWELANWESGNPCPNNNMILAEFSASIHIGWPPQDAEVTNFIHRVRAVLLSYDPLLVNWLEIGLLTNSIVQEVRVIKNQSKKSSKSISQRLLAMQNEYAKLLVKTNLTSEERQDIVSAVQDIINHGEDEAVPLLVDVIDSVLARFEGEITDDLIIDTLGGDEQMIDDLKGKVDFAIITIREDEYKAILKRFPKETIYKGNNRSYSISRVVLADGRYYLVAVVRSIEQGEGHGQDVARDAIEDLDPQWLLLVGIAGGVPAAEFTLGDVVIALRLTDFSVKAALEGRNMQYAVSGGPMHKQVQDYLALLPAMSNELGDWNSRTSIGLDKPPVTLVTSNFYGDENWQKKVKESLTRHFGPSSSARPPLFTTGAIVSSDTLVKDSQTLQQWQEAARQVLAVEMELGGVYIAARRAKNEYPILAIRGTSDIVGFKRHPDWTEYACQSAAAFARAFLVTRPIEPRSANTANDQVETFTLPKLPKVSFDAKYECEKLVKEIEFFFDTRTPTLEVAGIETIKSKLDDSSVKYRFQYKGKLTYFLSFWVEVEYGRYNVGFHDGWTEITEAKGKSYTAILRLESDINVAEPIIILQNFSLLGYSPETRNINKNELLEGMWKKTITTIESIVPQIRSMR